MQTKLRKLYLYYPSLYYPWTSLFLICTNKISIKMIKILEVDADLENSPRDPIIVLYSLML